MNIRKKPSDHLINQLSKDITRDLNTVEAQLKTLQDLNESADYFKHELDFPNIVRQNIRLENTVDRYYDCLQEWENTSELNTIQLAELNFTMTQLNRLSLANENVIRLSKLCMQRADKAHTVVQQALHKCSRPAR